MELRERRIGQIVRDFMQAYTLAERLGEALRGGELRFDLVDELVGEGEASLLYRLKEECHSLFRGSDTPPRSEFHAEELFDLAIGMLFHEGMKFREGHYLSTAYGPRFERVIQDGTAGGPMADAFRRVFEAGRRRMLESEAETAQLFMETRDQLRILLRQRPASGVIARSLLEDPECTEHVFGSLRALLEEVYGSPAHGYRLALESLIENGHFGDVETMAACEWVRGDAFCRKAIGFARGMAHYYAGDPGTALDILSECVREWAREGAEALPVWRDLARTALATLAAEAPSDGLGDRARALVADLS